MFGKHLIKCWSSTQASLALSSGEAEYYGVVRGTGIGLGQQALGRDAGFELLFTTAQRGLLCTVALLRLSERRPRALDALRLGPRLLEW